MLVIVEYWNVQPRLQSLLDQETLRRFNVLQIDAAKSRRNQFAKAHHFGRIFCIHLDIEDVHVREALEKHRLSFHDRL